MVPFITLGLYATKVGTVTADDEDRIEVVGRIPEVIKISVISNVVAVGVEYPYNIA
jgi:hypothetical protein